MKQLRFASPSPRWLQIMISNTLLFLQLKEASVLHLQAAPQKSLFGPTFDFSGSALPGFVSLCSVVVVPVKPKFEVTFRSPREFLIAILYIHVLISSPFIGSS